MYHRVNDCLKPDGLIVGIETFRRQMQYLYENGFKVTTINGMIDKLRRTVHGSDDKEIVIAFDDGYRDNFLNAYPALKKYAFPAIIFLITGMIGTDRKRPRYATMPLPDMLSWEEVREMAENSITFGAHTVNHPHLATMTLKETKAEIEISKKLLESKELRISGFAYPYGEYNNEVKKLVKEAGFDCAFTINPGTNIPGCDLFELKRTEISGVDSLFDFSKKLTGACDWPA